MPVANSNFRVRNGLQVSGNTLIVGNTTVHDNLSVNNALTVNGTLHVVKGNTNFGSDSLHVNATNKRVVVNASSTSTAADTTDWAFDVNGKMRVSNTFTAANTSQFNGAVTIGASGSAKDLTVWGDAALKANATVSGNLTVSGNSVTIGSGTTPNTVIEGNVWIKGTIKTGSTGSYYDLDDLNTAVGGVPILKVYDSAGTQLFP